MSANALLDTLVRNAIGFDSISRLPEYFANVTNFPPHNIEKLSEDEFRLTLAVAGFDKGDISLTLHDGMLTIDGHKEESHTDQPYPQMLYRGIAQRDFTRQFRLGEYVEVANATFDNGCLVVNLVRRVPEERKPKLIEVQ